MNEDAGKSGENAQAELDVHGKKPNRASSKKRSKTGQLKVEDLLVNPEEPIPPGSRFNGYHDFTVQDIAELRWAAEIAYIAESV